MNRLLPFKTETQVGSRETRVISFEGDKADEMFSVLSSPTARSIVVALENEPQPASAISENLEMSLQNVNYHLQNLLEADVVRVVDTWYSAKGKEMNVYASSIDTVIVSTDETLADRLRKLLPRMIGAIAALAFGALVFRTLVVDYFLDPVPVEPTPDSAADPAPTEDAPAGPDQPPERLESAQEPVSELTVEALDVLPFLLDPGFVFLLGGLFAVTIWVLLSTRR